jgi:hypothetical protein
MWKNRLSPAGQRWLAWMRCLRLQHLGQLATMLFIVLYGTSCLALMDPDLLWVAMAMMMAVVTCTRTPFLRVVMWPFRSIGCQQVVRHASTCADYLHQPLCLLSRGSYIALAMAAWLTSKMVLLPLWLAVSQTYSLINGAIRLLLRGTFALFRSTSSILRKSKALALAFYRDGFSLLWRGFYQRCQCLYYYFRKSRFRANGATSMVLMLRGGASPPTPRYVLGKFDGTTTDWYAWHASALAYFRRMKSEDRLLDVDRTEYKTIRSKTRIRKAFLKQDAQRGMADRFYEREPKDVLAPGSQEVLRTKGSLTPEALALLETNVEARYARNVEHNNTLDELDEQIYDELVMACTGMAQQIVNGDKSRSGSNTWAALQGEYGKLLDGDRVLFQKRLKDGEVVAGQKGMQDGDRVRDFIRDFNILHTALYCVVPPSERDSIPELQETSMKQTLKISVTDDLLPIINNFDSSKGGKATYVELCKHLTQHENDLDMRRAVRNEHPTGHKMTGLAGIGSSGGGGGDHKHRKPFKGKCNECDKVGHMRRDCPQLTQAERKRLQEKVGKRKGDGGDRGSRAKKAKIEKGNDKSNKSQTFGTKSKTWTSAKKVIAACCSRIKGLEEQIRGNSLGAAAIGGSADQDGAGTDVFDNWLKGVGAVAVGLRPVRDGIPDMPVARALLRPAQASRNNSRNRRNSQRRDQMLHLRSSVAEAIVQSAASPDAQFTSDLDTAVQASLLRTTSYSVYEIWGDVTAHAVRDFARQCSLPFTQAQKLCFTFVLL